jgi:hypothetical protein
MTMKNLKDNYKYYSITTTTTLLLLPYYYTPPRAVNMLEDPRLPPD